MSKPRQAAPARPSRLADGIAGFERKLVAAPLWASGWLRALLMLVALLFFGFAISVHLDPLQQTLFSAICFVAALILHRSGGRLVTLIIMMIALTVSLRYMYWRLTSTIGFEHWVDMLFGYGLLAAEIYSITVMLLSYFQSAWPLQRKPLPMIGDAASWPTVDVFIPTYNEPLDVVRQSVLTALSLDWPADKLNIYVLDDGRRAEFREFCEQAGVGYIARADNRHAKAGNINSALQHTTGEFIAIFDCDHIPTRSFLQICLGWFQKDAKLAMLQTPHVFFSPDPFERNLDTFKNVPNEGELFYGIIQDGNDLWNATFFCGSCAVLRRTAIEAVGGIATESVTEDALTALKMNRMGLNTAYLALPQAAGLATENLSRHIGQRIRWARGMAQIIRVNNPLLGPGLKFGQRLCYLNAMLHFFYGLPRVVFLTTPLAYLFFGAYVFQASALMVAVYAIPHLLLSNLSSSRMQGKFRHSFWNEVYESVLAWYIMRPALQTLISPQRASFNVTAKGGVITKAYFDWTLARPYIVLLVLNLAGLVVGVAHLAAGTASLDITMTILINLAWTIYNIMITSASVAVAGEVRQLRSSPRVTVDLPAALRLPNGKQIACRVSDYSKGGLGIQLPEGLSVPIGSEVQVSIFRTEEEGVFPAVVTFSRNDRLGLNFHPLTLKQEIELSQVTFARADTWASMWGNNSPDSPLHSLREISRIGQRGFVLLLWELRNQAAARLARLKQPRSKLQDTREQ